ncbi:MAG: MGMT family protein [Candidatus Delongbacteria bacterium]|jgi:methylated-DNA-protein-cysteine methyltransferase-like protein|nr:MGMT family protein [Candidatus Delongbacteria bacterium]
MPTQFTEAVLEIIKSIPKGKIQTYGGISKMAGSPFGARQVVRILSSMSQKYHLPWHRVMNSKGEIQRKNIGMYHEQIELLEKEGVNFISEGKIDLGLYFWDGQ